MLRISVSAIMSPMLLAVPLVLALTQLPQQPRLAVVISIDQFRADYLLRFQDLYLPANSKAGVGGFNYLLKHGANYVNAAYTHIPTETGPGHAVIGTGGSPATNGVVGNEWHDRLTGKSVYCVGDPDAKDVFTKAASYSPKNLLSTTMADELETVTGGQSKTVSLALKDRAAILMGGRRCDQVVWFEGGRFSWSTSDFYSSSSQLPSWADAMNAKKIPQADFGRTWTSSLSSEALKRSYPSQDNAAPAAFGKTFPHKLPANETGFYNQWRTTPFANQFIVDTAKAAISAQRLGKDGIPDILTLGLSCNDYTGHMFGPDSPEVLDMAVETDRSLADLFRALDKEIGLKNVLIVLTADHGVMQIPEEMARLGLNGARVKQEEFDKVLKDRLQTDFGNQKLMSSAAEGYVYLNLTECAAAKLDPATVRKSLKEAALSISEVDTVLTREDFSNGISLVSQAAKAALKSFNLQRSPDLFVFLRQNGLISSYTGATHGSPYAYDSRVPLLFCGPGVEPGIHSDTSGPENIAPTVCTLLRAPFPSGCLGNALRLKLER